MQDMEGFEEIKCATFDQSGITPEVRKRMNKDRDNAIVKSLIEELKTTHNLGEIALIEEEKSNVNWLHIDDEIKDLWYETLGDAKKTAY